MITRRRFLQIAASAAPMAAIGHLAIAAPAEKYVWHGMAMGAPAALQFYHTDSQHADRLTKLCFAEIKRLEKLFSLFDEQSTLSRLNHTGSVDNAPADFIALVHHAAAISTLTDGAFDVTVGPLWSVYADHFKAHPSSSNGPSPKAIAAAADLVDYRLLNVDRDTVYFDRPGMAASFNGIAQGFMADRIAAILRAEGLHNVLVDMGEMAALGTHADGTKWQVGIKNPDNPNDITKTVPLYNQALATSGRYGTMFDKAGKFHHLFDPRTGASTALHNSISVIAPTATMADGLSTGFSAMPLDDINRTVNKLHGVSIIRL